MKWNRMAPLALALLLVLAAPALAADVALYETVVPFAGHDWLVIGYDGEGIASEPGTATLLLAKEDSGGGMKQAAFGETNVYEGSNLQAVLMAFYDTLPEEARALVVPCLLPQTEEGTPQAVGMRLDEPEQAQPTEPQPIWPLSVDEALQISDAEGDLSYPDAWWLRSFSETFPEAYMVSSDGNAKNYISMPTFLAMPRPALMVDLTALEGAV